MAAHLGTAVPRRGQRTEICESCTVASLGFRKFCAFFYPSFASTSLIELIASKGLGTQNGARPIDDAPTGWLLKGFDVRIGIAVPLGPICFVEMRCHQFKVQVCLRVQGDTKRSDDRRR